MREIRVTTTPFPDHTTYDVDVIIWRGREGVVFPKGRFTTAAEAQAEVGRLRALYPDARAPKDAT